LAFNRKQLRGLLNRTAANVFKQLRGTDGVRRKIKPGDSVVAFPYHDIRKIVTKIPDLIDFARHGTQQWCMAIFYPGFENFDVC